MKRTVTCIICPRGCTLEAEINGNDVAVTGNSCPRGAEYEKNESINPVRTVTSSIRVENRKHTMVSVKTAAPIPKDKIFETMKLIRTKKACAPIYIGDIIIENVFGTDIIATESIK